MSLDQNQKRNIGRSIHKILADAEDLTDMDFNRLAGDTLHDIWDYEIVPVKCSPEELAGVWARSRGGVNIVAVKFDDNDNPESFYLCGVGSQLLTMPSKQLTQLCLRITCHFLDLEMGDDWEWGVGI